MVYWNYQRGQILLISFSMKLTKFPKAFLKQYSQIKKVSLGVLERVLKPVTLVWWEINLTVGKRQCLCVQLITFLMGLLGLVILAWGGKWGGEHRVGKGHKSIPSTVSQGGNCKERSNEFKSPSKQRKLKESCSRRGGRWGAIESPSWAS